MALVGALIAVMAIDRECAYRADDVYRYGRRSSVLHLAARWLCGPEWNGSGIGTMRKFHARFEEGN
jgi:hypothetical protein